MLVTTNPQRTLWETILPPGYQDLPAELAGVDALLDDPAFFRALPAHFSRLWGRPSIPIETYLRMMFLKHRYRLGYETLCREVADSLSWSRFCRIPLGTRVPHPSTLAKITARCGQQVIDELNRALLAKAGRAGLVRTEKARADTTVVPANVAYPTDSGLLVRAITLIVSLVARIHAAGAASRTTVRDRRRAAGRRARSLDLGLAVAPVGGGRSRGLAEQGLDPGDGRGEQWGVGRVAPVHAVVEHDPVGVVRTHRPRREDRGDPAQGQTV